MEDGRPLRYEDGSINKEMKDRIKTVRELKVYCLAFDCAMEIFELTKEFPKEVTELMIIKKSNIKYHLKNEKMLVLLCARTTVNADDIQKMNSILREELDWNHIVKLADRNQVLPLLYKNLENYSIEYITSDIKEYLKNKYKKNCFL